MVGMSAGSIMLGRAWVHFTGRDATKRAHERDQRAPQLFSCLGLAPVYADAHAEEDSWHELKVLLELLGRAGERAPLGYGLTREGGLSAMPGPGKGAGGDARHPLRYRCPALPTARRQLGPRPTPQAGVSGRRDPHSLTSTWRHASAILEGTCGPLRVTHSKEILPSRPPGRAAGEADENAPNPELRRWCSCSRLRGPWWGRASCWWPLVAAQARHAAVSAAEVPRMSFSPVEGTTLEGVDPSRRVVDLPSPSPAYERNVPCSPLDSSKGALPDDLDAIESILGNGHRAWRPLYNDGDTPPCADPLRDASPSRRGAQPLRAAPVHALSEARRAAGQTGG